MNSKKTTTQQLEYVNQQMDKFVEKFKKMENEKNYYKELFEEAQKIHNKQIDDLSKKLIEAAKVNLLKVRQKFKDEFDEEYEKWFQRSNQLGQIVMGLGGEVAELKEEKQKLETEIKELKKAVEHYKEYEEKYDELNNKINW